MGRMRPAAPAKTEFNSTARAMCRGAGFMQLPGAMKTDTVAQAVFSR